MHINAGQLIAHRHKRMASWNNHKNESYVDQRAVRDEIRKAMFIFDRGDFTVINVSNKPPNVINYTIFEASLLSK